MAANCPECPDACCRTHRGLAYIRRFGREKWYEEKIPDAELYSWGVKINENCPDEAIRYKAAHWFVQAAQEMERKERVTGKVSMSSYKGFFEKLADDLVGKK